MIDDLLKNAQAEFDQALSHLKEEYSKLQIGRASAALVEGIMVEAYGSKQPIKAMASISIPDAKSIQIQPWDRSQLSALEKAIQNSDLNINPVNDGLSLRLNMPQMTEERRRDLTKVVHRLVEEARIAVRHPRQKAMEKAKEYQKNGDITEDQLRGFEKQLQERVDQVNKDIEEAAKSKEQDVMTV